MMDYDNNDREAREKREEWNDRAKRETAKAPTPKKYSVTWLDKEQWMNRIRVFQSIEEASVFISLLATDTKRRFVEIDEWEE